MKKTKILIVDDEKYIRETLKIILIDAGYDVITSNGGHEALKVICDDIIDIVLTDYRMPGMNGVALMEEIYKIDPTIVTVIMSAYADIKPAIEAVRHGAFDYVEKVFSNEELLFVISRANEKRKLLEENSILSVSLRVISYNCGVIAQSVEMQHVLFMVKRIAQTNATTLITGESGVGKDVIAHLIHKLGERKAMPFIAVNCGAIPENLLEDELFGHEEGAFTGAIKRKKGKFILADGGTIFLDEIGELPLSLQVKLLRALQEKEIFPVGAEKGIKVDIRIIAATNKNMEMEVEEKRFRGDLFYRLNVVNVEIPPLRERKTDIGQLALFFLKNINEEYNKEIEHIDFLVIEKMTNYEWPGNVRELRNAIERAVVMAEPDCKCLEVRHFGNFFGKGENDYNNKIECCENMTLKDYEKIIIENALARNNYNKQKTAVQLGIQRQTLYNKMNALGVKDRSDME